MLEPTVICGPDGLTLSFADGRIEVQSLRPGLVLGHGDHEHEWFPEAIDWNEPTAGESRRSATIPGPAGVVLTWTVDLRADGLIGVALGIANSGDDVVSLRRVTTAATAHLVIGERPSRWKTWRNGYQSWSGTWTMGTGDRDVDIAVQFGRASTTDARHRAPKSPGHVRSDWLTAIVEPVSNDALAVGFSTLSSAYSYVELVAPDGVVELFEAWSETDGVALEPGQERLPVELLIGAETGTPTCGWDALRTLAEATGTAAGARVDEHRPAGWCSWYYHFEKVTEQDILASLAVLADDGPGGPKFGCEYVMVDDGHQAGIGDWLTTNQKFPRGMAAVASDITKAGFDAGIWWAPFLVAKDSSVALQHPDWLVRSRRGRPILGLLNPAWGATRPMWVLDTTRPEVLDHLRHVAQTITGEWGYRIQKLDFLYAASLPGVRFDPSVTRAQALRLGLDAIRHGAGDDAFLLGCGCPLGPAVGVVDAMRIGADVAPEWSPFLGRVVGADLHALSTKNAIRNTLTRAVLDRAWFLNDPDCLMVRDTDTKLNRSEVESLATAIGVTDGMIVVSDAMDKLAADRIEMVGQTIGLGGGQVTVIDLFDDSGPARTPHVVVSEQWGHVDVALFNHTEHASTVAVDVGRFPESARPAVGSDAIGTELWTGTSVGLVGSILRVDEVPAHGARVVRFSR